MKLIQRNRTAYYKCGKVANVILVGSPTLSGTVISGFSSSKYAHTPLVPQNVESYEIVAKFTIGAIDGTQQGILANSITNRCTPQICISTSNTLNFDHPKNADAWVAVGNITASANTTYWAKAVWDGSYAYFYYKTSESVDWTLINKKEVNTIYWTEQIGIGIDGTLPFKGSIDLQKCYIKINGRMWWTGTIPYEVTSGDYDFSEDKLTYLTLKENKTIHYKYGNTPNVRIVGSPTVSNGVMSGFSSANYGVVFDSFAVGSKSWEMVYKIRTGSNVTTGQSFLGHTGSSNYDPASIGVDSSKFNFNVTSSSSSNIKEGLKGTYTVLANTDYWLKFVFDGTKYVLSYSLNGKDFIQDIVATSSKTIWTSNLVVGRQQGKDSEYPFLGSIDLKGCYIKVNNKLWWTGTVPERTTSGDYDYSEVKTVCLGVR